MIKLLLIEDDEACAYTTQGGLELIGNYEISLAKNGLEGWNLYQETKPDVVVSDIDMPLMDGFELIQKIRKIDRSVIIIMETGKTSPKDVVNSFQMGVDDYIKKPFVAEELHVRIEAIMKKAERKLPQKSFKSTTISIGNYTFDLTERTLELKQQKLKLTQREADILKLLYDNKNTEITRETILSLFWEKTDFYSSRSLDVFISKIRRYLAHDPLIEIITIRGVGVMLKI